MSKTLTTKPRTTKDQYGDKVKQDLTLLTNDYLHKANEISKLKWYQIGNDYDFIFVSAGELEEVLDGLIDVTSPAECMLTGDVCRIDDCLHRFNQQDGFYHA